MRQTPSVVESRAAVGGERLSKRYVISGSVQGVGYRLFAQRAGERLGLGGTVRNLRDGRVEVCAEGTGAQLAALRAELERGPRAAGVSSVSEEDAPQTGAPAGQFTIEF